MDDFDLIWNDGMTIGMGDSVGTVDELLNGFLDNNGYSDALWQGANWSGTQAFSDAPTNAELEKSWGMSDVSAAGGAMDVLKGVNGFIKDNKESVSLAGGILGHLNQKGQARQASADEAAKRQRISESIVAMKQPKLGSPGLLSRASGSRVFDDQGRMVR